MALRTIAVHTWYCRDDQRAFVQCGDRPLEATESLHKVKFQAHHKVNVTALEDFMGFLVQDDDDVTGLQPGLLISLSGETNVLTILHSCVKRVN